MNAGPPRPLAILGARLVDPSSAYDGPGAILVRDGRIREVVRSAARPTPAPEVEIIDAGGAMLCPGLVDLCVKAGEPGLAGTDTLQSTSRAAAAGGVTTIVVQPDTDPVMDEPALVEFVVRRGRSIGLVDLLPSAAATRGLAGLALAEIGLLREAGCVMATNAGVPIADSRVMRRLLAYCANFQLTLAHRPADPWLRRGAVATEGELSGRLGLAGEPVVSEIIGLQRDLALAALTGARLLVDQITAAEPLKVLERAVAAGAPVQASASINHLMFNDLDIGEYRTRFRLDPPLRAESDRQALVEAVRTGLVEIIVSAHAPATPQSKRAPFAEAAAGAIGLETLLPVLIGLHHEAGVPLLTLVRAASLAPARVIGSDAGRLAPGAPADMILCDIDAPWIVDPETFAGNARNSAFTGRRVQGRVLLTIAAGKIVHRRLANGARLA